MTTTEAKQKTIDDLLFEAFRDKETRAELSRRCVSELKVFYSQRKAKDGRQFELKIRKTALRYAHKLGNPENERFAKEVCFFTAADTKDGIAFFLKKNLFTDKSLSEKNIEFLVCVALPAFKDLSLIILYLVMRQLREITLNNQNKGNIMNAMANNKEKNVWERAFIAQHECEKEMRKIVAELKELFKSRGEFVGIEKLESDDFSLSFEFYFPEAIDEQELVDGIEKILRAHGAKSVEIDGYQYNGRRTVDANFLFEQPNNGLACHG